jgi:hypothetical protein
MLDFVDGKDKCFCGLWRFPVTGGNKLVLYLCTYSRCTLYSDLTTVHYGMYILTSNRMLHLILASSGHMDDF